tara:strand:+ start:7525 stop:8523 length:999 start_codon:yes stop_codon:yes gene_type:complete
VDNTKEYIRHLSLCSGYEGIGLGLRRVLPNCIEVAHVEIEAFAIANLVAKMEENKISPAPIWTDLKTFPYEKFLGQIDILSGGFPCQPFSHAGSREGVEDPRHLYPYISDGIGRCRPRLVFLENVEGIISSKTETGRSVLLHVLQDLESMGYIAEAGVFSASEVGAPHQRKRVFILAHNDCQIRGRTSSEQQVKIKVKKTTRRASIRDGCDDAELADSDSIGSGKDRRETKLRTSGTEQPPEGTRIRSTEGEITQGQEGKTKSQRWPSRPREPQHEWEEPRTTPKPKLGGATNGTPSRVDRLRLLGNGVVPQTVEVAFRTLSKRIEERIKLI